MSSVGAEILGPLRISGALYESMLVVWTSSTGPEILVRTGPLMEPLTVLLLVGLPSESPPNTLARRVVNARASDILAEWVWQIRGSMLFS